MTKYYQPSGKFNPIAFIYFIISTLIAFPIIALIYTYLVWYIPFVYINFFITAGFGFLVGVTISQLSIKVGKVRNPKIAFILGLVGGLIALYFSWVIWIDLVINAGESYGTSRIGITTSNIKLLQVFQLALHPQAVFDLIAKINEVGTWGIRGGTVSGIFLSVFWVIEALIVIVLSVIIPNTLSKLPFCEFDNKWFDEIDLPAFNLINNTKEMVSNLEMLNQKSFDDLQLVPDFEKDSHSIFTLYSSNKGENFLSIENNVAEVDNKGEVDFKNDLLIEYVHINSELKSKLLAFKNVSRDSVVH